MKMTGVSFESRATTITVAADPEAGTVAFYERGYTDGLPVIMPTPERVERMLGSWVSNAQTSIGKIQPSNAEVTLEKVAINAVMAGCAPEHFDVLMTAIEVALEPAFDLGAIQATTNPLTPLIIVNGPIRDSLHLNGGTGAMGPGFRANATIGRALRLVMQNLGAARPGGVDRCTQGFVGKYTFCFAENEAESPWEPFHVALGYKAEESVATVVAVNASTNIHDSSGDWEDVIKTITSSISSVGTANVVDPDSTPVLALNPAHARMLATAGYDRKRLQEHLFQKARIEPSALSERRRALRLSKGPDRFTVDGRVPITNDPRHILIVVVGGTQGGHSSFLPNGHYGHASSRLIPSPQLNTDLA